MGVADVNKMQIDSSTGCCSNILRRGGEKKKKNWSKSGWENGSGFELPWQHHQLMARTLASVVQLGNDWGSGFWILNIGKILICGILMESAITFIQVVCSHTLYFCFLHSAERELSMTDFRHFCYDFIDQDLVTVWRKKNHLNEAPPTAHYSLTFQCRSFDQTAALLNSNRQLDQVRE